ncbi:MAG: hypothetical protein Ct9H90mP10_04950 [Actinomycetota bacterium]|nr:MAG: hypothetical protein Ct9H90mP10_04950 [Actinomycetota bacterium]
MVSGSAIKPGDVLKTRNGKTIEVMNTDAEGRFKFCLSFWDLLRGLNQI